MPVLKLSMISILLLISISASAQWCVPVCQAPAMIGPPGCVTVGPCPPGPPPMCYVPMPPPACRRVVCPPACEQDCVSCVAAPTDCGNPLTKLVRGAVNTLTGWVELPRHVCCELGNRDEHLGEQLAVGLTRGGGQALERTLVGAWETISFPVPSYEPLIYPEYVATQCQVPPPCR
jgi:putative exosortase-associated protein (TIGR04073 family)